MNKKGFTLIELLIIVAIIGILAMIAIPGFIGQGKKAARTEAYTNLQNLRLLQEQFFAENGEYAPNTALASSTADTTLLYGVFGGTTYDTETNPTHARNIRSHLRGFRPGLASALKYNYVIEFTVAANNTTAFIARATGKAGTNVADDNFTLNQDNVRGGGW